MPPPSLLHELVIEAVRTEVLGARAHPGLTSVYCGGGACVELCTPDGLCSQHAPDTSFYRT